VTSIAGSPIAGRTATPYDKAAWKSIINAYLDWYAKPPAEAAIVPVPWKQQLDSAMSVTYLRVEHYNIRTRASLI
jgi:hypothetical protein